MTGTFHRRLRILLGSATAALVAWWGLPGTAIDRAAFATVARGFANPPLFIAGNGSHAAPWNLRTLAVNSLTDTRQAPVIVALGDDRDGFFQSSPPSPIDLAVIFTNFQRLGATKAASAVVLAWDAPDVIGLAALDKAIHGFDSLVMAAPLSRGAVPEPMPPAFRRASVSLDSVHGDAGLLPVVNRIPLPGVILGADNTAAGFQVLDTEPDRRLAPLLARWEDRVVFAFPLLCALQRLDLTVEGLEIRLGEYLKLGPGGPVVPIDSHGRLAMPLKALSPYAEIPAEALIDGGHGLFPAQAPPPVVLRDDRSAAEPATRAFSKQLPALIAALASDAGLAPARDYPRLPPGMELGLLLLVALALAALCALPAFTRQLGFLTIAGAGLGAQFLAAGTAGLWLPGLPVLAAIGCAAVLSRFTAVTAAAPQLTEPAPPQSTRAKAKPTPKPAPKPDDPLKAIATIPREPKPPARKSRQPGKKRRK